MEWEAIRENLGLVIFAGIWLLTFLMRAVRGKGARGPGDRPAGPMARRRRARRRALILGFVLMAIAAGLWEFSTRASGGDEAMLRIVAGVLALVAILAILFAGINRPESPVQGEIDLEKPAERAVEISANEPLDPS